MRDRQSQAGSLTLPLRREERGEQPALGLGGHTDARVDDLDHDVAELVERCSDLFRATAHCPFAEFFGLTLAYGNTYCGD